MFVYQFPCLAHLTIKYDLNRLVAGAAPLNDVSGGVHCCFYFKV
jgi:hypothetical protein